MKCKLSTLCKYVNDKIEVSKLDITNYVSTENMVPNKNGITTSSGLPNSQKTTKFNKNDILVSNIRPYFKKIWFADREGGCSNDVIVFRALNDTNPYYLYYTLSQDNFFDYMMKTSKGTKMPRGDKNAIINYEVEVNDNNQEKVISLLVSIDKKIKLNNKINKNLAA